MLQGAYEATLAVGALKAQQGCKGPGNEVEEGGQGQRGRGGGRVKVFLTGAVCI